MNTRGARRVERARRRVDRLVDRGRETWIGSSIVRSHEQDLALHTLAIAAQQVLCTVPLLLAVSVLLRRFHAGSVVVLVGDLLQLDAPSRKALASLFWTRQSTSLGNALVELLFGVFFLTGLAATTQSMLETVWAWALADRRPVGAIERLWRQLLWVAAASPCLAAAMASGRWIHRVLGMVDLSLPLAALLEGMVALVFYWWTQHMLLCGRIGWRPLLPGAVLSGIGIALATLASAWLVPGQVVEQSGYYGPIGAAMVLSLWLMGVTVVVVAAALAGAVLEERRSLDGAAAAALVQATLQQGEEER